MFEDKVLQIISSYGTLFAALGAVLFGWMQYNINRRLQRLSDYVAVSIVPFAVEGIPKIQIRNVGKINLYLHKWEIGGRSETYTTPRLLGCGPELFFVVSPPDTLSVEMPMKMYLTDEYDQKYISTGSVIIDIDSQSMITPDQQGVAPQQLQALQQFQIRGNVRAWSYKTKRFNWKI